MLPEDIIKAYKTGELTSLQLGSIIFHNELLPNAPVNLCLSSFNRHGLIAGSTGSGKTKTMQVLSEQLSLAGVPSLVMDVKGDVSGLSLPADVSKAIKERAKSMDLTFKARGFPVELYSLDEQDLGIALRATIEDFGALLLSRMLGLNDTQTGVLTILFVYAKEQQISLVDLDNLKELLQFALSDEGGEIISSIYGNIAASSIGSILRKIIELEAQGGKNFFGKPTFNIRDLFRTNNSGQGIISILRLMDLQDRPMLFSTFMLKLLSDVYRESPEIGDAPKPKLVIFIDEAHLIFAKANKALLNLLETTVKLIRSKGIGIIFSTQSPNDIPEEVLSQLGLKIQHSLRAFTAKDRKDLKLVAQNFPISSYYDTEQLLTSLKIGDALVSALDNKGQPTPLIQCRVRPPESRMGSLTNEEVTNLLNNSNLYAYYKVPQEHVPLKIVYPDNEVKKTKIAKESKSENIAIFETLSKNTLIRQIIRDMFKWLLKNIGRKK